MDKSGEMPGSAWVPMRFDFDNELSFEVVADVLHDAMFRMADIEYDAALRRFTVPIQREATELPPQRKGCLFGVLTSLKWTLVPCVLTVLEVRDMRHSDPRRRETVIISEITYDRRKSEIEFETGPPVDLVLKVDRLHGELKDLGEPV